MKIIESIRKCKKSLASLTPTTWFIILLLTAFALRLYLASITIYLWDEDRDWIPLAQSISFQTENLHLPIRGDFHSALAAYFIKLGTLFLGETILGFRLFSLLAGLLTLVVVWRLADQWAGPKTAFWATALLAFNEYHVAISMLAIQKVFFLLAGALAIYTFSRFLINHKAIYLYLTGGLTGLAFLFYEISALLIPVFLITLFFSQNRNWLLKKELFFAGLVFFIIISPDLYWNFISSKDGATEIGYSDHLSRIGGIGLNKIHFAFFFRDLGTEIYRLLGLEYHDPAGEYPAMNTIFGILLFGSVVLATFRLNQLKDPVVRFLLILFWFVFLFFLFIQPGKTKIDPAVWLWVDLILIPAVLICGFLVARLQGWKYYFGVTLIGAAILYSVTGVFINGLGMSSGKVGFDPELLLPADGRLVEIRATFIHCILCDQDPKIEITDVRSTLVEENESGLSSQDVIELSENPQKLNLRATRKNEIWHRYTIKYRITDQSGKIRFIEGVVHVPPSDFKLWKKEFWIK